MRDADTTAGLPPPPVPPQERPAKPIPQNIADLLVIVRILLGYGLHLAETLDRRAASRSFSAIAQFFGTARVATIRARLARGLLRAMALEELLLARAARGRDLVFYKPRIPSAPPPRPHIRAPVTGPLPPQPRPLRRPDPDEAPDPDHLPTVAQLRARMRGRPVGQALADICRDLAISPRLCDGPFWLALSCGLMWYRGNLPKLMKDFRRREVRFCDTEADRNPALDWPEPTRDGIRRILGFRIGEPPDVSLPLLTPALAQDAVPRPP